MGVGGASREGERKGERVVSKNMSSNIITSDLNVI